MSLLSFSSHDVLYQPTSGSKGAGYIYSASYDALRQLISWQNQATSLTQTASYAYNGSGERVQQSVTSGGGTTTTKYLGGYEEVSVTGGTTTTTQYYSAGLATVANVNGTLSYLAHDTLGSVSASLTASGGLQSAQLFAPYGGVRYSTGTMPTTYGFTGQRSDPSGLMYYHARYYDPSVGLFASADVVQGPNRYGYVAGNPETATDPTGNYRVCPDGDIANCPGRHPPVTSPPVAPPPVTPATGHGGSNTSSPPANPALSKKGCVGGDCVTGAMLVKEALATHVHGLDWGYLGHALGDLALAASFFAAFLAVLTTVNGEVTNIFTAWLAPKTFGAGLALLGQMVHAVTAAIYDVASAFHALNSGVKMILHAIMLVSDIATGLGSALALGAGIVGLAYRAGEISTAWTNISVGLAGLVALSQDVGPIIQSIFSNQNNGPTGPIYQPASPTPGPTPTCGDFRNGQPLYCGP